MEQGHQLNSPALAACPPGLYAVQYRDSRAGDPVEALVFAVLDAEGGWAEHVTGARMLQSEGDAILQVWCLQNAAAPNLTAWFIVGEGQMPPPGVTVLACYRNGDGKLRRIRAEYIAAHSRSADDLDPDCETVYDEATDTNYWPEGWYEVIDNWGDYSHVLVTEGVVGHWTYLPAGPCFDRMPLCENTANNATRI